MEWLARVLGHGRVIIAGPTLLRRLRRSLDQLHEYGARLMIIDAAINRKGATGETSTDSRSDIELHDGHVLVTS